MTKYFYTTKQVLNQFEEQEFFVARSESPAIDYLQLWIKKGNRCFEFKSENIMPKSMDPQQLRAFSEPIKLSGRLGVFNCPHGFAEYSFDLTPPDQHLKGEIRHLESGISDKKAYFRYVVEHKDFLQQRSNAYLHSELFGAEQLGSLALHVLTCNMVTYHFYEYQLDGKICHIIDSLEPVTINEFENAVDCINLSFGFISGFIPLDERFIFQSPDIDFKRIVAFSYKRLSDTIKRGLSILDKHRLSRFTQNNEGIFTVDMMVFSNLVNHCFKNVRFRRALQLITDANSYPMNIRASIFYVALETIRTIIITETPSLKPIKDKKVAQKLISELTEIVLARSIHDFNDKTAVLKRIEYLNQPQNKRGFIQLFEHFEVELTSSDEEALSMRDKLLHGELPYEAIQQEGVIENEELIFFTLKIRFLIAILVMKYSGFKGLLLNLSQLVTYQGRRKNDAEQRVRLI